ncbi:MAG: BBP7 family outer membrane beta-barrel protein [Pirellulaceae bacterium]
MPHPAMHTGYMMPPQMQGGQADMYAPASHMQAAQPGIADAAYYQDYAAYGDEGYIQEGYGHAGVPPRAYGSLDLMLMWRSGGQYPGSLLTTSDPVDRGILGNPSTQTLFGGTESDDPYLGGRLTMGLWLDDYQDWSIGGRFLGLGSQEMGQTFTSEEFPTLAFPFFDTVNGVQDSFLVALPGDGDGAANTTTVSLNNSNDFYTGDFFVTKHLWTKHATRLDFVTGYNFARIDDTFSSSAQFTVRDLGGSIPEGTVIQYNDMFAARNTFHGGQLGLLAEFQDGPITWRGLAKLSLGNMEQQATIRGSRLEDGVVEENEGIYARNSNSGEFSRNRFAFVPEANFDMIYAISGNLDLKLGTTFIYFNDVATGGSLINPSINPNVGGAGPPFQFNSQDFWVLGMNFGIDYHY